MTVDQFSLGLNRRKPEQKKDDSRLVDTDETFISSPTGERLFLKKNTKNILGPAREFFGGGFIDENKRKTSSKMDFLVPSFTVDFSMGKLKAETVKINRPIKNEKKRFFSLRVESIFQIRKKRRKKRNEKENHPVRDR